MLLPDLYDMFVAGSTSAARDIAGVAMCIDLDCNSPSVVSLSDCNISVSFDQPMISYLICLDKPSNRDCWITDSTMPQYCVDPKFYETQGEVYTYGLLALVVNITIYVGKVYLCWKIEWSLSCIGFFLSTSYLFLNRMMLNDIFVLNRMTNWKYDLLKGAHSV